MQLRQLASMGYLLSYLALLSVCFRRRMLILYAGLVDVYTGFVASGNDRPVII